MPDVSAVPTLHQLLSVVAPNRPTDYKPYGLREREGPDCSCGCKHFAPLDNDELRTDWGVCINPASPRFGLLTFEHAGCPEYEPKESARDE